MQRIVIIFSFCSLFFVAFSQKNNDTLSYKLPSQKAPHSPHKAAIYSAILPGLGQIYNRAYWKLPLLYGGIGGLLYAYIFNNQKYQEYTTMYQDLVDLDPNTRSYEDDQLYSYFQDNQEQYTTRLQDLQEYFKDNRDRVMVIAVILYFANIVDALYDAHFWRFDIDDNLTMETYPMYVPQRNVLGLGISINF